MLIEGKKAYHKVLESWCVVISVNYKSFDSDEIISYDVSMNGIPIPGIQPFNLLTEEQYIMTII